MSEYRVLLSTAPSRDEAQSIARALVERRLAACVNIAGPIQSVYRWKGEVEEGQEFLLIIKTTESLRSELQNAMAELHSYEVPELIEVKVDSGLPRYLAWIDDSVKKL